MRLRHKFRAQPVNYDGHHYASKLEFRYLQTLELQKKAGLILFFLRQVPFHLPGGVKYICDFQVFYVDGVVKFVDVKGVETSEFIIKKKLVEATYPINIEVIKRGDF